jgi:hypothetical protein
MAVHKSASTGLPPLSKCQAGRGLMQLRALTWCIQGTCACFDRQNSQGKRGDAGGPRVSCQSAHRRCTKAGSRQSRALSAPLVRRTTRPRHPSGVRTCYLLQIRPSVPSTDDLRCLQTPEQGNRRGVTQTSMPKNLHVTELRTVASECCTTVKQLFVKYSPGLVCHWT